MSPPPEFGKPSTDSQALSRLPGPNHPEYELHGSAIEHLVHFRNYVVEMLSWTPREGQEAIHNPSIGQRWIPLGLEDMKLLEEGSFRRDLENPTTVDWECIRRNNPWSDYFPSGDDEYRWWQITDLVPALSVPSAKLVCVESNSKFQATKTDHRFNEHSEFDIFVLTSEELNSLITELSRNSE